MQNISCYVIVAAVPWSPGFCVRLKSLRQPAAPSLEAVDAVVSLAAVDAVAALAAVDAVIALAAVEAHPYLDGFD